MKSLQLILLAILFTYFTAHADHEPCYYAPNNPLSSNFISCGISNTSNGTCCLLGDLCLEHGACYNDPAGMTYIAGCTDISYTDSSFCPGTHLSNRTTAVQGLAQACDHVNWVYCTGPGQEANLPSRTDPDSCTCAPDMNTLVSAPQLAATASLPSALGGSVVLMSNGQDSTSTGITGIISSSFSASTTALETASGTSTSISVTETSLAPFLFPGINPQSLNPGQNSTSEASCNLGLILGSSLAVAFVIGPIMGAAGYYLFLKKRAEIMRRRASVGGMPW